MSKSNVLVYLCVVLALSGCVFKSIDLESRWAPLTKVYETGSVARGVTMTIDHACYVHDLRDWQRENPLGSDEREALLLHEQAHSKRQLSVGPFWYARYALDRKFRWEEEKLGYQVQISYLVQHLKSVDTTMLAAVLSGSVYDGMVSYPEALAWVQSVIAASSQ